MSQNEKSEEINFCLSSVFLLNEKGGKWKYWVHGRPIYFIMYWKHWLNILCTVDLCYNKHRQSHARTLTHARTHTHTHTGYFDTFAYRPQPDKIYIQSIYKDISIVWIYWHFSYIQMCIMISIINLSSIVSILSTYLFLSCDLLYFVLNLNIL